MNSLSPPSLAVSSTGSATGKWTPPLPIPSSGQRLHQAHWPCLSDRYHSLGMNPPASTARVSLLVRKQPAVWARQQEESGTQERKLKGCDYDVRRGSSRAG
ncbi:hypothetical protein E2C01_055946 [Portunus trituberculatus]|uniref:Uncharacterized protein n=1 Tax=Portunus trituberculatus TaxID=210409 RepID=A0A5B7GWK3_PORTR|nr:hypothetical protein [Portunus trituberculatus]